MSETASVTTSTLAVAEKRPRKTGGCVGIFFQLFDWNRRFAKKKLFSKRLLPPDRAKEASKKLGGDDKLPKLRLIADENSGGFPHMKKNGSSSANNPAGKNGVETPSLVARLMGLESMPSVKLLKNSSNEFSDGRKEKALNEFEKESIRQEFRPQKLRKTETIDRRNVTRFGAEALQLKNVLSRSRKHHHHHPKLASPVKNNHTKTNSSRLIGAANRILEPGRNKSKYAIMYAHSSRSNSNPIKAQNENVDFLSGQTSCKNCGNPVDNARKSVFDSVNQPQPPINFENNNRKVVDFRVSSQPKVNTLPKFNNDAKDFVALNINLSGRTRPRVPTKVEDTKFDKRNKFDNQGQKRQFTHIRKQGESCGFVDSSKSFKFNSPVKNMNDLPRKRNQNSSFSRNNSHKKFTSNRSDEKKPFPLKGDCLSALLEEKLHQLTNQVQVNGNLPKRSPANIFQELICALNMEKRPLNHKDLQFCPQRNHLSQKLTPKCEYDHKTSFFLQAKPEKAGSLIGGKINDHFSPGSVLEASFSNDSCCSSSLEDSSVRTQHADSMSYSYDESQFQESETDPCYSGMISTKPNTHNELATNLITYISQVLSTIDFINSRITRAHIMEVIFNSELVLANQIPHNPDKINSFFVCDLVLELDSLVEIMFTKFGNFLGYESSKQFIFDALIEYLELKYGKYSKCGFRVWMNIPRFMGCESLIDEVMEEVRKWMCCFVVLDSDELVEWDMSCCLGKWIDFEVQEYEMGAKIEGDVVQMLIDEIVFDFLTYGL